jgi:hypothetical protein
VKKVKKAAKTPKKPAKVDDDEPMIERRKSGRAAGRKSYAERPDEKDDEELEELQGEEDQEDSEDEDVDVDIKQREKLVVQESITVKVVKTNGSKTAAPLKKPTPATNKDVSDDEISDPPTSDEE